MRRMELMELHDHPLFPASLRNLVTDALEALWEYGNSYKPILPQLQKALSAMNEGAEEFAVVDLCSGGGGPWMRLAREFEAAYGVRVRLCLTDKYPSREAAKRLEGDRVTEDGEDGWGTQADEASQSLRCTTQRAANVEYRSQPVDAMKVPNELCGFRTMFSSFHHFALSDARAVLRDAAESRRGIGIFEVPGREFKTLLMVCLTPLLVLAFTPWIRPFRWSRLLWTYLVPVVPFVIWFDGCMSCFRAYSHEELREMVRGELEHEYQWEIGEARGGFLPVTYLLGWPTVRGAGESSSLGETSNQPHEVNECRLESTALRL